MKIIYRLIALASVVAITTMSVQGFSFFVRISGMPAAIALEILMGVVMIAFFSCFFFILPEALD